MMHTFEREGIESKEPFVAQSRVKSEERLFVLLDNDGHVFLTTCQDAGSPTTPATESFPCLPRFSLLNRTDPGGAWMATSRGR